MAERNETGRRAHVDLTEMTREELVRLGLDGDGVRLVRYSDQWPVGPTRAERRAVRQTLLWFVLATVAGLAFGVVYVWWPWRYVPPDTAGYGRYSWYTPLLGILFGAAILCLAIGMFFYVKRFIPDELAVQERHDGVSPAEPRASTAALLADAAQRSGIRRRTAILGAAGVGAGVVGAGTGVLAVGGLLRNPWSSNDRSSLWRTGWYPANGEKVYLRQNTADPERVVLVRPEDMAAGGSLAVFPFRESERGRPELLREALERSDNPAMLIRLRPGTPVAAAAGQQDYNYGQFYAYSRVCTHLGCPAALYQQQDNIMLCPCHQSQFDMLRGAQPIFGPADRPLPQLPIALDESGYLVARGDFSGPVGPDFWELGQ
jgi:ubiquinol-cytochrome c reductase iron-sulfur subunit